MNVRQRLFSRVYSDPDLRDRYNYLLSVESNDSVKKNRSTKSKLNLKIPSRIKSRTKHFLEKRHREIVRQKNELLAKVTALKHKIFILTKENKKLEKDIRNVAGLKSGLKRVNAHSKAPKREIKWMSIQESMHEFKSAFDEFLEIKRKS